MIKEKRRDARIRNKEDVAFNYLEEARALNTFLNYLAGGRSTYPGSQ